MQNHEPPRASLTIRNIPKAVKEGLRVQAAKHGHSMEAEARRILQEAITRRKVTAIHAAPEPGNPLPSVQNNFYERIHARFAALGGIDLELPVREPVREPSHF